MAEDYGRASRGGEISTLTVLPVLPFSPGPTTHSILSEQRLESCGKAKEWTTMQTCTLIALPVSACEILVFCRMKPRARPKLWEDDVRIELSQNRATGATPSLLTPALKPAAPPRTTRDASNAQRSGPQSAGSHW